jgi:Zn-dependent protease with chaperone function
VSGSNAESDAVVSWDRGRNDSGFKQRFGERASDLDAYVRSVVAEADQVGDAAIFGDQPPATNRVPHHEEEERGIAAISEYMRVHHPELTDTAVGELCRMYSESWGLQGSGKSQGGETYVGFGGVEFHAPSTRRSSHALRWITIGLIFALGAWSVMASWHSHVWLGALAAFIFLEFGLAAVRGLQFASSYLLDEDMASRIAKPLIELCAGAGCKAPQVGIIDRSARGAYVRMGRGSPPQLTIARPVLDRLDDLELRAVMAHEVSHLAGGDLMRAQRRIATGRVGVVLGTLAVFFLDRGKDIAFPIYLSLEFVGIMVVTVLLSLLQRSREVRADSGAVRLTGDPEHLVTALAKLSAIGRETRRLVFAGPWRVLLLPMAWKLPSHPSVASRTSRIMGVAAASGSASS